MEVRNEKISRERFIRLGGALGVSIAGASALAGCGGAAPARSANGKAHAHKSGSNGSNARGSGGRASAGGQEIARVSQVPAGSAANFTDSGTPAVLVHLRNGGFAAYSAVCTHQGCTVVYQNGKLACPCHGSVFDPSSGGAVLYGPAPSPLPRIPIRVRSGGIYRA